MWSNIIFVLWTLLNVDCTYINIWLHLYQYKYFNTTTAVNKHSNLHGIFNMKTYSDGGKANDESHNIRQHVERIRHQSDGVCDVTDDDFHEEKAGCHWQHGQQATCFPGVAGHDGDLSHLILRCLTPHNGYLLDPTMSNSLKWISSRSFNVPLLTMDILYCLTSTHQPLKESICLRKVQHHTRKCNHTYMIGSRHKV